MRDHVFFSSKFVVLIFSKKGVPLRILKTGRDQIYFSLYPKGELRLEDNHTANMKIFVVHVKSKCLDVFRVLDMFFFEIGVPPNHPI